jgi:hypothetical protein
MSPAPPPNVLCAKGAICYCLDEFSKGPGSRSRLAKLRKAIADLAPAYAGLAEVFDEYLVSHVFASADTRRSILEHLKERWFDANSRTTYFPRTPVSRIYAEGLLQTLDLSLKGGGRTVPINSWWVLDSAKFRMLNFADVKDGMTVGGNVTLLIMTPRPKGGRRGAVPPWILGEVAEAYVTEQQGRAVATRRVKDTP